MTFALTDTVGLTVGARYTKDKKKMYYDNPATDGILGVFDGQILGPITDGPVYADDSWSSFDPRVALDWDFQRQQHICLSILPVVTSQVASTGRSILSFLKSRY